MISPRQRSHSELLTRVPHAPSNSRLRLAGVIGIGLATAGCVADHPQSVIHPAGEGAARIEALWWFLLAACTVVFVVVMAFVVFAIVRRPLSDDVEPPLGSTRFIIWGGIIIPAVVLVVMLFASLGTSAALRQPESDLTIRVTGHLWWWEVDYPDEGIKTANELYIPAGRPVRLELTSADVIHSFWVPSLHGKKDLVPGHINEFWITAERPGTWRGQCAEYCGTQHALMAFVVVSLPPEEFDQWVAARQRPHPDPSDNPAHERGRSVFFSAACNKCHMIRGSEVRGEIGPDLTHIGSRLTLGAGTIPNNHGNLAGWLVNPQAIKPGNRMPRTYLSPQELHDLTEYLLSLQ